MYDDAPCVASSADYDRSYVIRERQADVTERSGKLSDSGHRSSKTAVWDTDSAQCSGGTLNRERSADCRRVLLMLLLTLYWSRDLNLRSLARPAQ